MRLWTRVNERLPARRELGLVLLICTLPIHIWSWLIFFYKLPSYLLSLNLAQTWGVFAYLQSLALLETFLLWGLLVLLAVLLPTQAWRDRFVSQSTVVVAGLTLWAVVVQYHARAIENQVEAGSYAWIIGWSVGCLVGTLMLSLVMRRLPWAEKLILGFADRIIVLASLFLFIDFLGTATVVVRNLIGMFA